MVKRLSIKRVSRKKYTERKLRHLFNAYKNSYTTAFSDRDVPLKPELVKDVVRRSLVVCKNCVWGAEKISIKRPLVYWDLNLRTYHGKAYGHGK